MLHKGNIAIDIDNLLGERLQQGHLSVINRTWTHLMHEARQCRNHSLDCGAAHGKLIFKIVWQLQRGEGVTALHAMVNTGAK